VEYNLQNFDNCIHQRNIRSLETLLKMKDKINPDDDGYDASEEYFKKKGNASDNEIEVYFPLETSKPPHY